MTLETSRVSSAILWQLQFPNVTIPYFIQTPFKGADAGIHRVSSFYGKREEKDLVLNLFTAPLPFEAGHTDYHSATSLSNSLNISECLDVLTTNEMDSIRVTSFIEKEIKPYQIKK